MHATIPKTFKEGRGVVWLLTFNLQVNYISYVALTKEFLPIFKSKKDTPTSFI